MSFQGFTPQTGAFLWELGFHNERPWFLEHKEEFEQVLNRPFKALAADTAALMQQRFPERSFQVHASRIYRDARRLFGRGPYKDHLWFAVFSGSRHTEGPMFWFEIGAATYSYGMGCWDASPDMMEAFRRQIDANPVGFERMVKALDGRWKLWGEPYKRPKGERGEIINPWYNRKYVSVGRERDLEDGAFEEKLPLVLADAFQRLLPLYDYIGAAWRSAHAPAEER